MSLEAIKALRNRLKQDADLMAFWDAQYGKQPAHYVGYDRAPNTNDFPSLCYVPTRARRKIVTDDELRVSLIVGVKEADIVDEIFDGVTSLDAALNLIMQALTPFRLSEAVCVDPNDIDVIYDLGMRHPFHELEIQLRLHIEEAIIDDSAGFPDAVYSQVPDVGIGHEADYLPLSTAGS